MEFFSISLMFFILVFNSSLTAAYCIFPLANWKDVFPDSVDSDVQKTQNILFSVSRFGFEKAKI